MILGFFMDVLYITINIIMSDTRSLFLSIFYFIEITVYYKTYSNYETPCMCIMYTTLMYVDLAVIQHPSGVLTL